MSSIIRCKEGYGAWLGLITDARLLSTILGRKNIPATVSVDAKATRSSVVPFATAPDYSVPKSAPSITFKASIRAADC